MSLTNIIALHEDILTKADRLSTLIGSNLSELYQKANVPIISLRSGSFLPVTAFVKDLERKKKMGKDLSLYESELLLKFKPVLLLQRITSTGSITQKKLKHKLLRAQRKQVKQ